MIQLHVKGMTCNHCKQAVIKAIQSKDPEATVSIELSQGLVEVQSKTLKTDDLALAIDDAGYDLVTAKEI